MATNFEEREYEPRLDKNGSVVRQAEPLPGVETRSENRREVDEAVSELLATPRRGSAPAGHAEDLRASAVGTRQTSAGLRWTTLAITERMFFRAGLCLGVVLGAVVVLAYQSASARRAVPV